MLQRDASCTKCSLHAEATNVCLLGSGPKRAKVMIVGEAPGRQEDREGQVFIGKSGAMLDAMIEAAGFSREDVYVTNAIHCRPPDNRTPKKKEIEACSHWLMMEIEQVKPKFILTLGNIPLQALTGKKGIKDLRGKPIELKGDKPLSPLEGVKYIFPTYHPAFALRDPRNEPVLRRDIATFFEMVKRGKPRQESGLNVRMILDKKTLMEAVQDLENEEEVISFDLETSGLNQWEPGSWVTSLGLGTEEAQWCLPVNHRLSPLYRRPNIQKRWALKLMRAAWRSNAKKVAHNGKFDTLWAKVHWGEWFDVDVDTMLAHYNLDENSYHGLDKLASAEFNAPEYDILLSDKHGLTGSLEGHCKYLGLDLYYTRKLWAIYEKRLAQDPGTSRIFYELTMPVARLYTRGEFNGVYVHPQKLRMAHAYWDGQAQEALSELDALMPKRWLTKEWKDKKTKKMRRGINWASPQQVAELLFVDLKLEILDSTPKGEPSVAESVLLRLADKHPIPKLLIKYREAQKNLGTFVEGWQKRSDDNHRMHPNFKVHGTVTGRPSCEDPNLQQTPRDPRLRSLIDAPDGWVLVDADESQAELRITAEMSGDRELLLSYQTGVDVHTLTVQRIFGIMKPTKEERKKGKAINFGFVYGMGWRKFKDYARDNYGVDFTDAECKKIRKHFFRLYAGLPAWHERQRSFARRNGYVRSLIGRKRRLPDAQLMGSGHDWGKQTPEDARKAEAERQAINSPVQSLASDINLLAAVQLQEEFGDTDFFEFIGSVHDANLWLIREDKLPIVLPRIKAAMERPKKLDEWDIRMGVPMITEVEIGPWGAATHLYEGGEMVEKK